MCSTFYNQDFSVFCGNCGFKRFSWVFIGEDSWYSKDSRYTNADMKIYRYLCFYIKVICRRVRIVTALTFWDMRTGDIWDVCLETYRNNRICEKVGYLLRKMQTSRVSNSRILRIENAKCSGYYFDINPNIQWNFQIYISLPLSSYRVGRMGKVLHSVSARVFCKLPFSPVF